MPDRLSGRLWAALAAMVAGSTFAASTAAVAAGQESASANATVNLSGADAVDVVDCRNQTGGSESNRCSALAQGGDVSLDNVDIYFKGTSTIQVNGGAVNVVSASGGNAAAGAICVNDAGQVVPPTQISVCLARAQGGGVRFLNVQIVVHHKDGTTTTKRLDLLALDAPPPPTLAVCVAKGASIADCEAQGGGAHIGMSNVDMVDTVSNTTRSNVDISVDGGDATATAYCGNSTLGSTRVQINLCSATAEGGDVTLRNVRLDTYGP